MCCYCCLFNVLVSLLVFFSGKNVCTWVLRTLKMFKIWCHEIVFLKKYQKHYRDWLENIYVWKCTRASWSVSAKYGIFLNHGAGKPFILSASSYKPSLKNWSHWIVVSCTFRCKNESIMNKKAILKYETYL